jgi:DNA polymerase
MNDGFFSTTELPVVKFGSSDLPQCGACGLHKTCTTPKMPPSGSGKKKILIVAEAPGEQEDIQGRQLVGNSGMELEKRLRKVGINLREDCRLTSALICRPPHNEIDDNKKIDYCRPNLIKTIKEFQPEAILVLGGVAVRSLISWIYKEGEADDGISKWVGWPIPSQTLNAWIVPTYHPSFLLHSKNPVADLIFDKHLKTLAEVAGRGVPWPKGPPNYDSRVVQEMDQDKVVRYLQTVKEQRSLIAFDYECSSLKPDNPKSRILCAAVSDGKLSVAFPFLPRSAAALADVLKDPHVPKIGYNIKFEHRWTRKKLGVVVRGWKFDGMIAAHVLDNRARITSLKFQAFVKLGQPDYDSRLADYMTPPRGGGGNDENRLREVGMSQLLQYCGMDALLEYKIGKLQAKELGINLLGE